MYKAPNTPPLANTLVQVVMPPPQPTIIATDPRAEFLKGIKHVITAYKEFSDNKKWFDWKEDVICQAQAQAVSDMLDGIYIPSIEQKPLFDK